jgi:hypothetical protein
MFKDVQYVDIEYMIGFRIFTINQLNFSGLSTYQQELENKGIRLILIEVVKTINSRISKLSNLIFRLYKGSWRSSRKEQLMLYERSF